MNPWWTLLAVIPYTAWRARGVQRTIHEQRALTEQVRADEEAKTAAMIKQWRTR